MGSGDRLELRGLRVLGRCGAGADERSRPQPLEVDLDLTLDLAAACDSDRLGDTVDYAALCDTVVAVVGSTPVALLERLVAVVAEAVLGDARVSEVGVAVRKLRPPVPQDLATAGVRITRRR